MFLQYITELYVQLSNSVLCSCFKMHCLPLLMNTTALVKKLLACLVVHALMVLKLQLPQEEHPLLCFLGDDTHDPFSLQDPGYGGAEKLE